MKSRQGPFPNSESTEGEIKARPIDISCLQLSIWARGLAERPWEKLTWWAQSVASKILPKTVSAPSQTWQLSNPKPMLRVCQDSLESRIQQQWAPEACVWTSHLPVTCTLVRPPFTLRRTWKQILSATTGILQQLWTPRPNSQKSLAASTLCWRRWAPLASPRTGATLSQWRSTRNWRWTKRKWTGREKWRRRGIRKSWTNLNSICKSLKRNKSFSNLKTISRSNSKLSSC